MIRKYCYNVQSLTYLLIIIINTITITDGFNLENRLPIIKTGTVGTYFGYSVASHGIIDEETNTSVKCLLVGAPLGTNYQPKTNHSGALFKCPLTQNLDDCEQVITDGRRMPGGSYESNADDGIENLSPPTIGEEIKDGQWMGVTVRSQGIGGKVLVCAHRYITQVNEAQHGQGLCYLLTNSLQYDDTLDPCKGRPTYKEHEEYGYCQAGTSGTLFKDDTVLLGTPGPYTWRGTVFVVSFEEDYLKRDKNHYYGPHTELSSPVDKYSYLGMAVAGGNFFNSNNISYAAGAPRSNGHGQVVIFSKKPFQSNPMDVSLILDGEQFGSSFGYELTTADVNGDGLLDLLVAAPFYFSRHEGGAVYVYQNVNYELPKTPTTKLIGKLESRFGLALTNLGDLNKDGCDDVAIGAPYESDGVVYIYLGSKSGLSDKPSQIIRPSDLGLLTFPINTFGSSLSGGIDLDDNGYPDLLIGAYNSAVVIALLSRPITNIKTEVTSMELKKIDPSKSRCADDPTTNLTCFSFQACCSIEPYESSTSKFLDLQYTVEAETFNNKKKFSRVFFGADFTKRSNVVRRSIRVQTNGNMDCRSEIVYVKENTRDIQSPIKFRLNYTIVEPDLPDSGLKVLHPILDQTQADRQFEASFQKDCGDDDICESQLDVNAEIELERDGDRYTLLLGQNNELHLNVTVSNKPDSAYEAQLFIEHLASVSYIAALKGSVICNRFNDTIVACTLGNPLRRDTSTQVTLRFDPSAIEDSSSEFQFIIFANSTSKQIEQREKTKLKISVVKRAEVSIAATATPEQSFYGGEIKGESAMKYLDDIGPLVEHTYQIYNDGPWRAPYLEVFIQWPYQVANDKPQGKWLLYLEGTPIVEGPGGGDCEAMTGQHNIFNPLKLIKRNIKSMDVLIDHDGGLDVGSINSNGRSNMARLTKMNKTRLFTGDSSSTTTANNKKQLESFSSSSSSNSLNRLKRDRSLIIRSEQQVDKDGKKTDIVHMDCTKNTAKCVNIKCTIYNMPRKTEAYITVRARIWNSTLVADYPRVDQVNIVSHVEIKIPNEYGILQNKSDDRTFAEALVYPELSTQIGDTSIPLWIIIVSIVGGLLLLALFTYILWRLGFFKRRRPDPTLSGNLEKNSESKQLLKKNNKS